MRDPPTGNQIPRDFIRLLPSDIHPPIPHRIAPAIMTADAALNNTNVDLSTAPCLSMAVNFVVRSENDINVGAKGAVTYKNNTMSEYLVTTKERKILLMQWYLLCQPSRNLLMEIVNG
jgi:hypothetical protein